MSFSWSLGILKAIARSANTLFYAHFGSLSSWFSSRIAYPLSTFLHIHIYSLDVPSWHEADLIRKPRSKIKTWFKYLSVTFKTLKILVDQKPRLYDGQQLKRTEKQLNYRPTKHCGKIADQTPDFSCWKLLANFNSLTIVSRGDWLKSRQILKLKTKVRQFTLEASWPCTILCFCSQIVTE